MREWSKKGREKEVMKVKEKIECGKRENRNMDKGWDCFHIKIFRR